MLAALATYFADPDRGPEPARPGRDRFRGSCAASPAILRGVVPSNDDHERIVARVRRVEDVVDVHSLLQVRDESDFGDPAVDPREWLNLRDATFPY